jgi:hypothetical protein
VEKKMAKGYYILLMAVDILANFRIMKFPDTGNIFGPMDKCTKGDGKIIK